MGWFEDNGYDPYESGGIAGGRGQYDDPGYMTQQAPPPQQGGGSAADAIQQAYQQYLGRQASPDEIASHLRDPNFNLQTKIGQIQNSQEAQAYAARPPAAAAPAGGGFNAGQQVGHNGTINGMNREQYRDKWMSSGAKSMDDLRRFISENGGTLQSDNGTVMTPFGESMDLLFNARGSASGNGEGKPIWGGGGGGGGQAVSGDVGTGVPLGAIGAGGGYSAGAAGGGGGSTVGQAGHLASRFDPFVYQDFVAPEAFHAPTLEEAQADPGYEFARKEGERAAINMGSRLGSLASGEFGKALTKYNSDYATTRYGDVYGRRASEYDRAYGNALGTNQANNSGRLGAFTANTNADLGYGNLANSEAQTANSYSLGQGQLALGNRQADQSYALGLGNLDLGRTQAANSYALGMGNLDLGWGNYGLNAQGQNFNQQYSLANLGL